MAEFEIEDQDGDSLFIADEGKMLGVSLSSHWVDIDQRGALRLIKFLSDWLIDQ